MRSIHGVTVLVPTEEQERRSNDVACEPSLQHGRLLAVWSGVLLALLAIVGESTTVMGHSHTGAWLHLLIGSHLRSGALNRLNTALRKSGHVIGYGMVGMATFHAVLVTLASRKQIWSSSSRKCAAALSAVLFTFLVAVGDEVHQHYLPGRTASVRDVALDTCGAILFLAAAELVTRQRNSDKVNDEVFPVITPTPVAA